MNADRLSAHPIVQPRLERREIEFFFENRRVKAFENEMISTALFANGIQVFGEHPSDHSPQGIFCANGQCSQCLVLADGRAVKSCVVPIKAGMVIEPIRGLPVLPSDDASGNTAGETEELETDVFIMGGGPAGLSAAIELGLEGVDCVLADDKMELGGKLSLQTHNFFGSAAECNAGVRGMDIGRLLVDQVKGLKSVSTWTNAQVVSVFADGRIGVVKEGSFVFVKPKRFLVAAGAREKFLAFPGADLPGVYGAGAFQTLVNRDLIKPSRRLFIVGGGNVGLIAAYHALQAGIDVIGIVEALPECGGYKVHLDKIRRLGIPVWTSHSVLRAKGSTRVESVVISEIDNNFNPIPGTEGEFEVDTLLIAVGLSPVNELLSQAKEFGIDTYAAGDADVIAEASAAMFGGKISGRRILKEMGVESDIPLEWEETATILKTKHDDTVKPLPAPEIGANTVYPVIRCVQEIPCDPCAAVCSLQSISMVTGHMTDTPRFKGKCLGCGRCVSICPGLSITLVDRGYDPKGEKALAIIPWELPTSTLRVGDSVTTSGFEGEVVGRGRVVAIHQAADQDRRRLIYVETPADEVDSVAGLRMWEPAEKRSPAEMVEVSDDEIIICRCERVTKRRIKELIQNGCNDFNALKAELRVGMGACGGKTCTDLIWRIFMECGVELGEVGQHVHRPFEQEVPLKAFIKGDD